MVKKVSDYVHIMHNGHIVEHGKTAQIFSSARHPYTIKLLESIPKGKPAPKSHSQTLLKVDNLHCHFPIKKGFFKRTVGEIKAVNGVDLTIDEGTTYGIVGDLFEVVPQLIKKFRNYSAHESHE